MVLLRPDRKRSNLDGRDDTTRSTVEFSDNYRVQAVLHERTDDGTTYRPSMKVTLIKVE
jgi:hypothetical protein